MSKIKETIKDEVIDNSWEHSQHKTYQENCSECYKRAKFIREDAGRIRHMQMLEGVYD